MAFKRRRRAVGLLAMQHIRSAGNADILEDVGVCGMPFERRVLIETVHRLDDLGAPDRGAGDRVLGRKVAPAIAFAGYGRLIEAAFGCDQLLILRRPAVRLRVDW